MKNFPPVPQSDPVPELQRLLGSPVVFINWPRGVKGSPKKWKHLRHEHMTPEYLCGLRRGNIGVALGGVSGGLCAIDLDADEHVEPFVSLNPALSSTLQTHGSRGRVFWLRFNGDYPRKSSKLKNHSGDEVGEFRSNGNQSIVWGTHPDTQRPYQRIVNQPAVVVDFTSIKWPSAIQNPPEIFLPSGVKEVIGELRCSLVNDDKSFSSSLTPSKDDKSFSSSLTPDGLSSLTPVGFRIQTLDDVLRYAQPHQIRTNNGRLFDLARGLMSLELIQGTFSPEQIEDVFDRWYHRAVPFLRPGRTRADYRREFDNARQHALHPVGGVALQQAWMRAKAQPHPPEAMRFNSDRIRLLTALCFQLHRASADGVFYLASPSVQGLFGLPNHMMPAKWLGRLCRVGVIAVVTPGTRTRATRYQWRGLP